MSLGVRIPLLALFLLAALPGSARTRFHLRHHAQSIGTRNRVHVNRLITEAGTVEMEAAASWSENGDFVDPLLLKYTPGTRIEYSVGFDYAHPGNDVTVAANSLLYDGEHWNVSLGPSLTFVRRDGDGLRPGATLITRYDRGLGSVGVTASWSKATRPTDSNPADYAAIGLGGGIRLGKEGRLSHWTLNGNVLNERASSTRPATSFFEGLEWEATSRLSVNFVVQQLDVRGANHDNQALIGVTLNFGRLRLH